MWNHPLVPRFARVAAALSTLVRTRESRFAWLCLIGLGWAGMMACGSLPASAQEPSQKPTADEAAPADATQTAAQEEEQTPERSGEDGGKKKEPPFQLPKSWRRVTKDYEVWIDFSKKQVIVGGHICLREGMLEMFACPKGTKEHESIISIHSPARFVHAALIAVGAKAGPPVQFSPEYRPAQGTEISVEVLWKNAAGEEQRTRAQEWVKHVKTGEELKYPWVFAGSGFWTDEEGKEQFYYGDGGEFICVSNFSTATLDLPVESSAANDTLMFSAFKERIPPLDTPVLLVLTPKLPAKEDEAAKPKESAPEKKEPTTADQPAPDSATPPTTEEPTAKTPAAPTADAPTTDKPAESKPPTESKKDAPC